MKKLKILLMMLAVISNSIALKAQSGVSVHSSSSGLAAAPPEPDNDYSWALAITGKKKNGNDSSNSFVMNNDNVYAAKRHCNNDLLFVAYPGDTLYFAVKWNLDDYGRLISGCDVNTKFYFQIVSRTYGVIHPTAHPFIDSLLEKDGIVTWVVPASFTGGSPFGYYSLWFKNSCNSATIEARILVIDRIESITMLPVAFCDAANTGAEDFKFKVVTTPTINNLTANHIPETHGAWSGGACESAPDLDLTIKFDMTAPDPISSPIYSMLENPLKSYANNFDYGGTDRLWPSTLAPESVKTFYFKYSDLHSIAEQGDSHIIGSVKIDDGVLTSKSCRIFIPLMAEANALNYNNSGAFFIFDYNKRSPGYISNHTAEPFGTIDAPAHETWTPTNNPMVNEGFGTTIDTIRIKDKLVIGKGQSLTIRDMVVEMGKDARIIVESDPAGIVEAGRLTLDNATIKSYRGCGNETNFWYGIFLHGNSSQSQAVIGSSTVNRHQATLMMYNNARITEARVGVGTYDPDNAPTRAGGIILADNAIFENNMLSVDIAQYYNATTVPYFTGYVSRFNHCSFTFNDENTKSSFEGFVNAVGVKDIPFTSCNFTTDFGTAMIGYGIRAVDASLLLRKNWTLSTPCYFKGLHDAVSAYKVAFGTSTTLYISGAQFTGNYTGVFSNAVNNPYMHNNVFQVPPRPYPSFAGRNCSGVNIASGSGYTLTGNSFTSASGYSANNNAALIWNSGSANNTVKGNTVSSLSQGMISNFINRGTGFPATGLEFLCNNISSNVGTCIAALGGNPSQDGMRAEQGSNSLAAGNTFAHVFADIYNPGAEVGDVNYFYNSSPNAEPTLNVGPVTGTPTGASDGCSSGFPLIGSSTGTLGTAGSPVVMVPGPVSVSGLGGIALREALLHNLSAYSLADTVSDRISMLHSTLAALGDAYSDLERVDLYLQSNELEAANTLYDGIVSNRALSGTEAYEFSHWGRQLLDISIAQRQAGKTTRELNSTQVSTLTTIADSAAMWAKVRAQNWLLLYDGRTYTNTFLYPPDSIGGNQRKAMDYDLSSGATLQNAVYPNPATDHILVDYTAASDKEENIQLQLTDVLGRTVLQTAIANKVHQKIAVDRLAPGLYFYTIREQNHITLSGKLIKK